MVYGWIGASHQLGASMPAFGAGAIRTGLGDYRPAFLTAGLLCLVAGASFLIVGRALRPDAHETRPVGGRSDGVETSMTAHPAWFARGLIFENCSCALVCPGHMHFSQNCTHERCKGYWALRVDEGAFGDVSIAGTRAVIAFDTPQRMIDGGWLQTIIIDEAASDAQRRALETILLGLAGGPWEKLATFVARRQPTEFRAIAIEDDGAVKRGSIVDRLKTVVTQIRGRDASRPVLFENIFNQIHAPTQVIALGESEYDDGVVRFRTSGSHGLFSRFEWRVGRPPAAPAPM